MGAEHCSRVVAAVEAAKPVDVNASILRSWRRCLEEYHLQPDRLAPPDVISSAEMRAHLQPLDRMVRMAEAEIKRLFMRLADNDYLVSLASADGVKLLYRCDEHMLSRMRSYGVLPGSVWNEESQGTNGIGTCIKTRKPISVVAEDHFGDFAEKLTCTVAPIFGHHAQLLCVLNVTTDRPSDRASQRILRSIVSRSAQRIENGYFAVRNADCRILRLSRDQDYIDLASEVRIAVDAGDRIVDASNAALALTRRPMEELIGASYSDLFLAEEPLEEDSAPRLIRVAGRQGGEIFARIDSRQPRRTIVATATRKDSLVEKAEPAPRRAAAAQDTQWQRVDDPWLAEQAKLAGRLIERGIPVLLQGETGTGKSAFARYLYEQSGRASARFVSLNCAAIPQPLIESELFGYRPGAFTGAAKEGARGRLLDADGGVLFLDEIGDMPLEMQTRLLHVLSDGEFTPLGSNERIKVDVAVISASLRNIAAMVEEGSFREDLFHRLNGTVIQLQPLRSRQDRLTLIESVFAEENAHHGRGPLKLDEAARAILSAHLWPGNLRELRHAARYACAVSDSATLKVKDLPPALVQAVSGRAGESQHSPRPAEENLVRSALERHDWNVTEAARYLGTSRSTLYRKMRRLGLDREGMV